MYHELAEDATITITTQQGEFAIALQYEKYEDGFPTPMAAQAKVLFTSQPNDADTLTITGIAYRFKNTPAAANDVKIGADVATTLANLLGALTGGAGTYYAGTKQLINAIADSGIATLFLQAFQPGQAGNSLTLAQSGGSAARYTLTAFAGGQNGGQARYSTGAINIINMPVATDTIVVGSTTYTISATVNTGNNINIALTGQDTVNGLANALAVRLASNVAVINPVAVNNVVTFANATAGAAGNTTVLTATFTTSTDVQVTGSGTLTGGADAAAYVKSSLTWFRLRTREVDYGEQQMQETIPLEIGGTLTPTGAYKGGVSVAGGAQLMPRLENSAGILLLATLGKAVTTNPSTGVYKHVFTFQSNEINQPWLAARKDVPGRDNVFGNGIVGYDNKVNLLRTTVAATAPIEMLLQLIGRRPEMDNHPETWLGNSFEDYKSIPMACVTSFKLPPIAGLPAALPVTQVVLEMSNVTTTPRDEMVVGSFYMDDVVARTRVMTIRFTYKWKDAALAQYLFGSQLKATAWSPTPFITNTDGNSNYAFDLISQAQFNIAGTTTPYSLEMRGNSVFWQPQPMRMRAGDIVTMDIIGTVLYNASGYVEFVLVNGQSAGYSVPSEP